MQAISEESGGRTFTAATADELNSVYENLGSELSVNLDVESSTTPLRDRRDRAHGGRGPDVRVLAPLKSPFPLPPPWE